MFKYLDLKRSVGAIGLAVSVLLLSGCGVLSWFSSSSERKQDAVSIVKRLHDAVDNEQADAKQVAEVPVRVNYSFKSKPLANHDLDVEIEYMALKAVPVMKVGYTTSEGLELVTQSNISRYQDLKQYQVVQHKLILVPQEENHYSLNIFIVSENGDEQRGKIIRVPIALGKYSLEESPTARDGR